jgi:hypothetical protein
MDDRTLMKRRADVLYRHDARGRMVESNEPKPEPAPRLFLGRTLAGDVVRFGQTVPAALAGQLTEIVMRQPPATDLCASFEARDALVAALEQHSPIAWEGSGPNYRFPDAIAMPSEAVQVTEATFDLVRDTFPWLYHDLPGWGPAFVVVRDGAAVSACFTARIGPIVCEAGVFTLAEFRGRGHAATATAAWGAGLQAMGRVPLYSTSWDNVASQSVAGRVGLIQYGADATWT